MILDTMYRWYKDCIKLYVHVNVNVNVTTPACPLLADLLPPESLEKLFPSDRPKRIPAIACFWSKLRSCWGGWLFLEICSCIQKQFTHSPRNDTKFDSQKKGCESNNKMTSSMYVRFLPCFYSNFGFQILCQRGPSQYLQSIKNHKNRKLCKWLLACKFKPNGSLTSSKHIHWKMSKPRCSEKNKTMSIMEINGFFVDSVFFCCAFWYPPKNKSIYLPTPDLIKKGHPLLQTNMGPNQPSQVDLSTATLMGQSILHCATFIGAITQGLAAFQPIQRSCGNNKQPISATTSTTHQQQQQQQQHHPLTSEYHNNNDSDNDNDHHSDKRRENMRQIARTQRMSRRAENWELIIAKHKGRTSK